MFRSNFRCYFLLALVFFLFQGVATAQGRPAKLVFKDGSYTYCKAKIKKSWIKYWESGKSKPELIQIKDLDYFQFKNKDGWDTYRRLMILGENRFAVLEELEVGAISLYLNSESHMVMGPTMGPGMPPMMTTYTIFNYYVNRDGILGVEQLARNKLFSQDFKKAAVDYFADCPALVKKLQSGEFKQRHLREIVQFYNSNCAEITE